MKWRPRKANPSIPYGIALQYGEPIPSRKDQARAAGGGALKFSFRGHDFALLRQAAYWRESALTSLRLAQRSRDPAHASFHRGQYKTAIRYAHLFLSIVREYRTLYKTNGLP